MSANPEKGRPDSSPRVHEFLETVVLLLVFVAVFTGLLFGLRYESFRPVLGAVSAGYLAFGLAPCLFLLVVVCALLLRPAFRRPIAVAVGRLRPAVIAAAAVPFLLATAVWTSNVPESRLALALAVAVPVLAGLGVARASTAPHVVLCVLPIAFIGAVLLVSEVPLLARPTPARWGDDRLFAYIHPKTPPFMGPGGRLRANLESMQMSAEFPHGAEVVTNNDGFRNRRDFSRTPGAETRVLSLGDSFSAGYAMPQDLFFGSQLEKATQSLLPNREIAVLNAEVSNPVHGLYYLQTYGLQYRPRLVIFSLSGNDLVQTEHFFGPQALFTLDADGIVDRNPDFDRRRPSPIRRFRSFVYPADTSRAERPVLAAARTVGDRWLRHLGGLSAVCWLGAGAAGQGRPMPMFSYAEAYERDDGHKRLIDGQADLGLYYRLGGATVEPFFERFFKVLQGLRRTAEAGGARFLLVMLPQRFQVQPQDWQVMCERWSLDDRDFDLEQPNRMITLFCERVGIDCLDLLGPMREAAVGTQLYLPGGDMHFNSTGTRVAAGITATIVEQLLVTDAPPASPEETPLGESGTGPSPVQ